jgi:hypothetical protein
MHFTKSYLFIFFSKYNFTFFSNLKRKTLNNYNFYFVFSSLLHTPVIFWPFSIGNCELLEDDFWALLIFI